MGQAFSAADGIVIQRADPSQVRLGAVVVVRRDTRWIVHRLLITWRTRAGRRLLTKGDAARLWDWPPAGEDALVGMVVAVRYGEAISCSARVRSGMLAMRSLLGAALAHTGAGLKSLVGANEEECHVAET